MLEVDSVAEAVEDVVAPVEDVGAVDDGLEDPAESFTIPVTVQTPSALPSSGGV